MQHGYVFDTGYDSCEERLGSIKVLWFCFVCFLFTVFLSIKATMIPWGRGGKEKGVSHDRLAQPQHKHPTVSSTLARNFER